MQLVLVAQALANSRECERAHEIQIGQTKETFWPSCVVLAGARAQLQLSSAGPEAERASGGRRYSSANPSRIIFIRRATAAKSSPAESATARDSHLLSGALVSRFELEVGTRNADFVGPIAKTAGRTAASSNLGRQQQQQQRRPIQRGSSVFCCRRSCERTLYWTRILCAARSFPK